MNKLTSCLVALGVVSLAGVAQAANPVVYLTGSTAARGTIANAMTTAGQVFDAGHAGVVVSPSPNNAPGGNSVVFEGPINGVTVDIDCTWNGSEAGIAAVAQQPLTQTLPLDPNGSGPWALPGVPPSFLTQGSGWTTFAQVNPDLSMADTSQAVSQTSKVTYPLVDYGRVGIVTFTLMKGYEKTPDAAWNHVNNVTTAEINQALNTPSPASVFTGVAADSGDFVAICGRNLGSGTRANGLLNFQYPINNTVDQYAYDSDYPSSAKGTLTFEKNYAAGQGIVETGNDGFDSGGSVAQVMQVDGTGSGVVLVGYLGVGDAKTAHAGTSDTSGNGGPATYLPFNGVFESDTNIIQGNYSYWGQEHLLGAIGQQPSSQAGQVAAAIKAGIAAQLTSSGAGTASGDITSNPSQSAVIPVAVMQVHRTTDAGFPIPGVF